MEANLLLVLLATLAAPSAVLADHSSGFDKWDDNAYNGEITFEDGDQGFIVRPDRPNQKPQMIFQSGMMDWAVNAEPSSISVPCNGTTEAIVDIQCTAVHYEKTRCEGCPGYNDISNAEISFLNYTCNTLNGMVCLDSQQAPGCKCCRLRARFKCDMLRWTPNVYEYKPGDLEWLTVTPFPKIVTASPVAAADAVDGMDKKVSKKQHAIRIASSVFGAASTVLAAFGADSGAAALHCSLFTLGSVMLATMWSRP